MCVCVRQIVFIGQPHLSVRPIELLENAVIHFCGSVSREHNGLAACAPMTSLVELGEGGEERESE